MHTGRVLMRQASAKAAWPLGDIGSSGRPFNNMVEIPRYNSHKPYYRRADLEVETS
jgi:hypothetical protein